MSIWAITRLRRWPYQLLCCNRCGRHVSAHYGRGLYCSGDGPFAFKRFLPLFVSYGWAR